MAPAGNRGCCWNPLSDDHADEQEQGKHRQPDTEYPPGQVHRLLQADHRTVDLVSITITGGMPAEYDVPGAGQQESVAALQQPVTLFVMELLPGREYRIEVGRDRQREGHQLRHRPVHDLLQPRDQGPLIGCQVMLLACQPVRDPVEQGADDTEQREPEDDREPAPEGLAEDRFDRRGPAAPR